MYIPVHQAVHNSGAARMDKQWEPWGW